MMVIKNQPSAMPDSYFELVRRFPLTHIRSLRHLGQAIALVDELLQKRLDRGAQEYLDALSDLIAIYEDEHAPIPDASESDVLRELMRSSGHKQMALSKAVGISQSTLSAILTGEREMTKSHMVALAKFFNVPPSVFLPS
ncbi:MAG: helix-turn-helix domain-containing protein [Planctomycetia bacterium]